LITCYYYFEIAHNNLWIFVIGSGHFVVGRITGIQFTNLILLQTLFNAFNAMVALIGLGAALGIIVRQQHKRVTVGKWLLVLPVATLFHTVFAIFLGLISPTTIGFEVQPVINGQVVAIGDLSPSIIIWGVFSSVIAAPVIEEFIFRGWLLPNRPGWSDVAWNSGLFTVIHLNAIMVTGVVNVIPVFIVGVFLGYLMRRFSNVWLCVGFHAAFNAVPLLVVLALIALGYV
jgi:membrane protease YdiL (CAAX protease family)